ncbi:unnamed protein product [Cuscuta epithymum]|uniref:Uncharacterized protein n=1 Tax=Cuscuta epithymum TaxID=186058 RepID=A0AAV0DEY0_9ASTE|nr:unnamed protein product [Cuscuta epithymum]
MGIQDLISPTANSLRRKSVGLVKQAWAVASRAFGSAAIKVHRLDPVRYMPDDETRAKAVVFSSKFARNAVVYAVKNAYTWIPGGKAVLDIYSKTMREIKSEEYDKDEEDRVSEHDSSSSEKADSSGHVRSLDVDSHVTTRKPEDELMISPPPEKKRVRKLGGRKLRSKL